MRLVQRVIRPTTINERRLLLALGIDPIRGLRLRRGVNPFVVLRRLERVAAMNVDALAELGRFIRAERRHGNALAKVPS